MKKLLIIIGIISILICFKFNWNRVSNEIQSTAFSNLNSEKTPISLNCSLVQKGSEDGDGEYALYQFSIFPSDIINKNIKVRNISWASPTNLRIEEYLSVEIDNEKQMFTVHSYQSSNVQAILSLCCEMNEKVSTSLTIDWEQKWKGFNEKTIEPILVDLSKKNYESLTALKNELANYIGVFDLTEIYTIPKEITYKTLCSPIRYRTFKAFKKSTDVIIVDLMEKIKANHNESYNYLENNFILELDLFSAEEFIKLLDNDIVTWNINRRINLIGSRFYGFELFFELEFEVENIKKKYDIDLYFFVPLSLLQYESH